MNLPPYEQFIIKYIGQSQILIEMFAVTIVVLLCIFLWSMIRAEQKSKMSSQASLDSQPLNSKQKLLVVVIDILNPVIGGAFFYYWWLNKSPIKAKQANNICWKVITFEVLVGIFLTIVPYIISHI